MSPDLATASACRVVMGRWRPFSGAVIWFYCLPLLVLFREGFYSDLGAADIKHWVVIAGLLGGGMGWIVCALKNTWRAGR